MATFLTSDWHLGEERMKIMDRPFQNGTECIIEMIKRHNSVVTPDDEVIVVGDVCYNGNIGFLNMVDFFNGKKILVRGNHDRNISDEDMLKYFTHVIDDGQGMELKVDDIECYAVHYPTQGVPNKFNLVGHIHGAWKYQLNMVNVGVDANHFYPINIEKIPKILNSINTFYDDDAWCAYDKINYEWLGKRGLKGSRFEKAKEL